MKLGASFPKVLGERIFTGGLSVRATMDFKLQNEAAKALRIGLEDYDRKYSPWRGPITTIDKEFLENDKWREILIKKICLVI